MAKGHVATYRSPTFRKVEQIGELIGVRSSKEFVRIEDRYKLRDRS